MKRFRNILFVSPALHEEVASTKQVISLTCQNQSSLTGLVVCPPLPDTMADYKPRYEASLKEVLYTSFNAAREQLNIDEKSLPFAIDIECCTKPAVHIVQRVISGGHDLLIKEAEPNDESSGFRAIDMMLLRKCPSPVWLSRPTAKPSCQMKVAVAIDPNVTEDAHDKLSRTLLEVSRALSDTGDGELHVISCWDYEFENYLRNNAWLKVSDDDIDEAVAETRRTHLSSLHTFIENVGIGGNIRIHHIHGRAEDVIPEHIEKLGIDILVMGTVARSGIPGFIIGNTAENTFQKLSCSLLALKPPGFVSPVSNG